MPRINDLPKPADQQFLPPSGHYFYPIGSGAPGTSNSLGVGTFRMARFYAPRALEVARVGAEITSAGEAGSKLRLGIYAENGSLALDAGTINGDSATVQEITLGSTLHLPRGWYFVGGAVQNVTTTQPTVRTVGTIAEPAYILSVGTGIPSAGGATQGYSKTGQTGALASDFGGIAGLVASGVAPPRLFFKLA